MAGKIGQLVHKTGFQVFHQVSFFPLSWKAYFFPTPRGEGLLAKIIYPWFSSFDDSHMNALINLGPGRDIFKITKITFFQISSLQDMEQSSYSIGISLGSVKMTLHGQIATKTIKSTEKINCNIFAYFAS